MSLRKLEFKSKINPTYFVVNEYLDFLSVNNSICKDVSSNSTQERLLLVLVSSTISNFN